MTTINDRHEIAQAYHTGHVQLDRILTDVLRGVAERHPATNHLWQLCESLRMPLQQHFEEEEGHGFLAVIPVKFPALEERCQHLRAEHGELGSELQSICDNLRSGDGTVTWWNELEARVHRFAVQLGNHESAECRLLEAADFIREFDAEPTD